ncbi:meiosis inhibitor protein 1-like [Misgurnus anguillicaudatus]|uniref:meiosis inhibitor protein 1-like n=1 Tax=Misgurnus anguillicaudatus TaxID=75329 RepID=UPI003CCF513A
MSSLDIICENIHADHALRWFANWERGAACVACVVEMIERPDVSSLRKRAALVCVTRAEEIRELLYCEENLRVNFTCSLMRMLSCCVDSTLLDQTVEVLLQMSLDRPQLLHVILDKIHSQLSDRSRLNASLTSFMFLGKLLDSHPGLSQTLTSSHLCVLDCVCEGLLVSDEEVKVAVCYVLLKIWSSVTAVHTLPNTHRDNMCVLLLHTLSDTQTTALTINCLGVLKQMLQYSDVVCVLMSLGECSEKHHLPYQPLPLIIKKLLMSSQESLQVVSIHCVCAILSHSPARFSSSFIQADLPEFLFECVCSSSEMMLWWIFKCLLLMSEDPQFFSQCHSVYGIESLVRCLNETLGKSNTEVQKQGLELLTAILDRQPAGVCLFPTGCEFSAVVDVIIKGVASSCLQVSMLAVRAAALLLRPHHQSSPVQFSDIMRMMSAVMCKCSDHQSVKAGGFLLQTLTCIDAACRLAEVYLCECSVNDSVCSSSQQPVTLETLCVYLLHCCDTTCIPTVTRVCERLSSPQLLQVLLSILSHQFSLCPAHMASFSRKLASSGFIRLTLQIKAQQCSENRNSFLNLVCCDFLLKLCTHLFSQIYTETSQLQTHVECILEECLVSLFCSASDWCSLLVDSSESIINTQYCLIYLLHVSLLHGDRLMCDSSVFSSVLQFICVQDLNDVSLPPPVQSSVIYLLSVTQHSCTHLDTVAVKSISKALSCSPLLFSLSSFHPSILKFIFCYPELSERFGVTALTERLCGGSDEDQMQSDLLQLLHEHPDALISMLVVVCEADAPAAHRAERVLKCFMSSDDISSSCDLCHQIKSALLNLLQKLTHTDFRVSVLVDVLTVLQSKTSAQTEMNHTDFKLLYHVSNLVAKMNSNELLLSVLNCLYCFLSLCPSHCTDRVVSLLLGNIRLMEVLENVLSPSSSSSSSSLQCSSLLLIATLISLQHRQSVQIHRNITIDLHEIVRRLAFRKRHTDSLLLMCSMRLLQVWLDVDECSLVCVSQTAVLQRSLQSVDGALHPLVYSEAQTLMTALCGLTLQKQDMMISTAVNCLRSLIGFLNRRNTAIVQRMLSQPWMHFLLFSLLSCRGSLVLHPAILTLITQLVCFGGGISEWKTEVELLCEEVERHGVTQITHNTLRLLLTQCCALSPPEGLRMRMETLLESLPHHETSDSPHQHMLHDDCVCLFLTQVCISQIDGVSVLLSDLTVNTQII